MGLVERNLLRFKEGVLYMIKMMPSLVMLYSVLLNSNGMVLTIPAKIRTSTSQPLPVSEHLLSSIYY